MWDDGRRDHSSITAVEAATQPATETLEVDIEIGRALESRHSSGLVGAYNMKEGLAAFLEKRSPVFKDQ